MARKQQIKRVRQYARPGCCYELPITIEDDNQPAPNNKQPNNMDNHTAAWMEALAGGRWAGRANKPAGTVQAPRAAPAQGPRKRAMPDVDEDNEQPRNGGAKRMRLSGGDSHATTLPTPPAINQPRHLTNNTHQAKTTEGQDKNTPRLPEFNLPIRQRAIAPKKAIVREVQAAETPTRLTGRARAVELRDQQQQSALQSNLHTMWQDHDREREAAEERRKTKQREQLEEAARQRRQTEEKRLGEIAGIEASIRSLWEADERDDRGYQKIRLGQYSAAGQRRAREREEGLRRSRF